MKRNIIVIFFLLCSPLATQEGTASEENSSGPERVLLSTITSEIEQYRGQQKKLILRLQHVYTDRAEVSFYDEENTNIYFDITGYREIPAYTQSLKHSYRGREYVVTCTIRDVDSDGDIVAELIRFEPYSLYQLPY